MSPPVSTNTTQVGGRSLSLTPYPTQAGPPDRQQALLLARSGEEGICIAQFSVRAEALSLMTPPSASLLHSSAPDASYAGACAAGAQAPDVVVA